MEKETHVASPEMKLFFEKLLKLKAFMKEQTLSDEGVSQSDFIDIYERLDDIIKEKQ